MIQTVKNRLCLSVEETMNSVADFIRLKRAAEILLYCSSSYGGDVANWNGSPNHRV